MHKRKVGEGLSECDESRPPWGRGWVFLFSKENSVRIQDKNLTQAHSELV